VSEDEFHNQFKPLYGTKLPEKMFGCVDIDDNGGPIYGWFNPEDELEKMRNAFEEISGVNEELLGPVDE